METTIAGTRPAPLKIAAIFGIAWNLFGVVQFAGQAFSTPTMLMAKGMTDVQAALYAALPGWMTLVFALGVFGGLGGSIALLFHKRLSVPIFTASLVGYLALYYGDVTLGVFAAFGGGQIAILTTVVAIAAALLALAIHARRKQQLA